MLPFRLVRADLPITDGLRHRRIRHHLRRLACAVLLAVCVYSLMQYISALSADTVPLLVARRDIRRGDILDESSLVQIQAPRNDALRDALTSESEGTHLTALIDIPKGQAIFREALTASVEAGRGLTKIRIRLASLPGDLRIGEQVRLVTSGTCASQGETTPDEAAEETSPDDESAVFGTSEEPCSLSEEALVVRFPEEDEDSGLFSAVRDEEAVYASVEFALPPQDALAVISHQSSRPILAVTTH
ncbi:MAG: SAF domain-containing protein [Bifidobacterium crudilactis]|jgi:hypothetical protein|nr:SAF domain-containing protein [Bifidobacterium crudilactis]